MAKKRIFLSPPWIGPGERSAVEAAFDSGYIAPCGPMVDAFDKRLEELSRCSAAAVASGSAALDLIFAELGVDSSCTVIAPSLTFIATIGAAVHRGAEPVFVDSDPDSGTISIPLLEEALRTITPGKRTIVVAADIYGQCCDYDALEAVCAAHGVPLVVDAAEAVGARCGERPAGCAGMAAAYSFNGNKIITTSGGGAVLSRDPAITARARWRAQQSREPVAWYEHKEVGWNYRMSNLLAAMGCAQLDRLPEIIRRKRVTFRFYRDLLTPLGALPYPCADEEASTHWLSVFIFPDSAMRDTVAARLAADDIECRPVWKPLHLQPVFRECRTIGGKTVEDLFSRGLCLPSGAGLDNDDLARIAEAIS